MSTPFSRSLVTTLPSHRAPGARLLEILRMALIRVRAWQRARVPGWSGQPCWFSPSLRLYVDAHTRADLGLPKRPLAGHWSSEYDTWAR